MGPFDHSVAWSTDSISGARRFLNRVWDLVESSQVAEADSDDVRLLLHQTIQKVTDSIEGFRFNTAISSLMELLNAVEGGQASRDTLKQFVLLVSPFAPHIAEELWQKLDGGDSVLKQSWPTADLEVVAGAQVTIPIQVNGKVRGELVLDPGKSQEETEMEARAVKNVQKYLEGKEIRKVIYVPDKLINFVVY